MDRYVERQEVLKKLNVPDPEKRLENLRKLLKEETKKPEVRPQFANNHIHTIYSFSPYSPTAAIYCARDEGLETAGIMDHDSIAGAREFREAGRIAGIGTTCGMECRVNLAGTRMKGKKLNNPDQAGICYMAIHSVPEKSFEMLDSAFAPLREKRNERNRKMTENINRLMEPYGIVLDFDRDVIPLSQYENGGSVTERHLLYALSRKIYEKADRGGCADFVQNRLGVTLNSTAQERLSDPDNPHLLYDLLGVMKAELVGKIYIPAEEECMDFSDLVKLADEAGAILCYPYLGDVTCSVTGDKKAAKFEDDFLDELFEMLKEEGVRGVTYMPARNTKEQLMRLQELCRRYGMTEISGEDVNSSRQSMICSQLQEPEFQHLVAAAWKLIERER